MKDVAHISLKRTRVKTAMVVALWAFGVAWSPTRAVGQCCGDCNGDGAVTVDEIITGVNHALGSCSDDGVCDASVKQCGDDAVVAGTVCMDKYEASVWRVPNPTTTNASLVKKIQQGKATLADLTGGGATQFGTASDDYAPCADNGQNCANDIYAVSLPGVTPSAYITWFQAQEACANARKRLPTNAEWQVAVNGTPDPGPDNGTTDCNTASTHRGGQHRLAQQRACRAWGLRHGGQPVRVGGGLGAALDGVPGLGRLQRRPDVPGGSRHGVRLSRRAGSRRELPRRHGCRRLRRLRQG